MKAAMRKRDNEIVKGWADCNPILDATDADAHSAEKGRPMTQNDMERDGCK